MGERTLRTSEEIELVRAAVPLEVVGRSARTRPYDRLLDAIGDARFVLLGEATHGSREFYRERAIISQRLIEEKGFDAVAVEADWPDAQRVHRFIRGHGRDRSPEDALGSFQRFPRWMWRNLDVRDFVGWLARHAPQVGFYGLDLYSLHASIEIVLHALEILDPAIAMRARERYSCFDHFGTDTTTYARAASLGVDPTCEHAVEQQLREVRELMLASKANGGLEEEDELFDIEMNAWLVKSAEAYYRNMLQGSVVTWNLRDRHMADTLAAIAQHLDHRLCRPCKIVVWEHNSHLGDARATQMGEEGEVNVGQLLRERYGSDAFIVGFTTYDGTVIAASEWGKAPLRLAVRPALANSHELLLHSVVEKLGVGSALFLPNERGHLPEALCNERLERAIGVVYRPQTESSSHWFRARLGSQFDALIHIDRTTAVEPLEKRETRESVDAPETYPFAL
jgi:erythromycin esterase-like protein